MTIREAFILDYGCGNFGSLRAWLAHENIPSWMISSSNQFSLLSSDTLLILPGVGSFGFAMHNIQTKKFDYQLHNIFGKVPILGICLGAQMMFESSAESQGISGLSWFSGSCTQLPHKNNPRIGWYEISNLHKSTNLFSNLRNQYFYFNHCYQMPSGSKNDYNIFSESDGCLAFFGHKNICLGCQFHPERSQRSGRKLLKDILKYYQL